MALAKKNRIEKTTMFNELMFLILGLALIAITACMKPPAATLTQPTATPSITTSSAATQNTTSIQVPSSGVKQAGDLRVWILTTPNPPISGSNNLEAFVIDTKGQLVSDAKLTFDINMTNMNMGRYVVSPALLGEGRYGRKVFFSMSGPWRVIISVERAGQTNTVRFDFTVKYK